MNKQKHLVGGAIAVCFALLAILTILHLTRNPNVGVSIAGTDDKGVLLEKLQQEDLQVHIGDVSQLPDGCAVFVVEAKDLTQTDAILEEAGNVPVVFVHRKPETEKVCYIGGDAFQAGMVQGALLLAQSGRGDWNEDGVVTCLLLGASQDQPDMQQWQKGVGQVLAENNLAIEFISYAETALSRQDAKNLCEQMLSTYGKDLETILVCYDSAVFGALDAVQASGRSAGKNLTLIGAGYSSHLAAQVAEGTLCGYAYMDEAKVLGAVIEAVDNCRSGRAPRGMIFEYTKVLPE